jgi:hypothetical protein
MRRLALLCTAVLLGVSHAAQGTTVVLFADNFSNGTLDMPVSINDPDPQADPENNPLSANTSLSGTILGLAAPGARAWHGDNADGGITGLVVGEIGGRESWGPGGAGSGTIAPRFDFNLDRALQFGRNFTVSLDDLDPVVGGGGTNANWVAISVFQPTLPANGGGLEVNVSTTPLGVLFRDNGRLAVFSKSVQLSDLEFDANPASDPNKTWDIDLVIDNISGFGPGNGFDYQILVDGLSITSGSIVDADTTNNFIGFEARGSDALVSGVAITSVIPEPSALGVMVLAGVLAGIGLRGRTGHGEET